MDRLWTPWRMRYVTKSDTSGDIFLDALEHADDPASLVLHRGQRGFIIMNLFPYNTGHMMVVPNEKVTSIEKLEAEVRAELFELVALAVEAARPVLRCDGFNVGLNIGQFAGAGVADHLHIHVVPRWVGDANFMPITANTMVLPEEIPVTYARLRAEIETILARRAGVDHLTAGVVALLPDESTVLLRQSKSGDVVLPKGHIEAGESASEAALRELEEETGHRGQIVGWVGTDSFELQQETFFTTYLLVQAEPTGAAEQHVGCDTLLASVDQAAGQLSFPTLQHLAQQAVERYRQRQVGDDA